MILHQQPSWITYPAIRIYNVDEESSASGTSGNDGIADDDLSDIDVENCTPLWASDRTAQSGIHPIPGSHIDDSPASHRKYKFGFAHYLGTLSTKHHVSRP
jgi:hypothetical protein